MALGEPGGEAALEVLGRQHPDKKVAKAARKAAHKAASQAGRNGQRQGPVRPA